MVEKKNETATEETTVVEKKEVKKTATPRRGDTRPVTGAVIDKWQENKNDALNSRPHTRLSMRTGEAVAYNAEQARQGDK